MFDFLGAPNINNPYDDPKSYLVSKRFRDRVDNKDVQDRFYNLNCLFLRVKRSLLGMQGATYETVEKASGIYVNHAVLYSCVYSYWYDILRLRDFHSDEDSRINKPKKAAYLIKWIVKEKPISFDPYQFSEPRTCHILSRVNEICAFRAALAYAEIPLKLVGHDITDKMTYNLAFRSPDTGMMSLWFETFMESNGISIK